MDLGPNAIFYDLLPPVDIGLRHLIYPTLSGIYFDNLNSALNSVLLNLTACSYTERYEGIRNSVD